MAGAPLHHSKTATNRQGRRKHDNNVVPITIRVTPEEKKILQDAARQMQLSYGQLVMELLRRANNLPSTAPKPSELQKLSPKERDSILQEQAKRAALLYAAAPDMIAESSDEVITY